MKLYEVNAHKAYNDYCAQTQTTQRLFLITQNNVEIYVDTFVVYVFRCVSLFEHQTDLLI